MSSIDQLSVHTLRMLSIDQIEQANSGHPGLPMGAAPMAYQLWAKHMRHNPKNPDWFNRDRFVLSAGHGSALLYSLLHLFGYDVSLEDLRQFRQWGSRTPGHPEVKHTPGVEATTGPLGQGISNGVGMALAERHLAAVYNRESFPIIDHFTYVLCSDGDLMEGVASEACSLAGHWGLGKLICLYDSNQISLDGDLHRSYSEDTKARFEAYGWQVLKVEDGNDLEAIDQAIQKAKLDEHRPTLIEINTIIGYGSQHAGTATVHGKPLGAEEVEAVRKAYQWEGDQPFHIPTAVQAHLADQIRSLEEDEKQWQDRMEAYQKTYPALAQQLEQAIKDEHPETWEQPLPRYQAEDSPLATRSASNQAIQRLAQNIPSLLGGSADLASSNNTSIKEASILHKEDYRGRNLWFGVREHGMGAILNGMTLHGGVRPYGGTFLVFSDYLRPSIRLAALSRLPVIYVFTHDSIAVGEDGPTHEPVEQIPSLRLIPNLKVIRPADANETTLAWSYAIRQKESPVALILSRQNLPILPGTVEQDEAIIAQGAYVVSPSHGEDHGILIATGSEVSLAIGAQAQLAQKGIHVRVVSVPCRENFDQQPSHIKEAILPSELEARIAIEAAHPMGWDRYVGDHGVVIGIDQFGASAPGPIVMEQFGFQEDAIISQMEALLSK